MVTLQLTGGFEKFRSRCRCEARRHRITKKTAAMPFFDESTTGLVGVARRLEEKLRRIAIHHCLADDRSEAASLRLFEKDRCRFLMDRGENQSAQRSVS